MATHLVLGPAPLQTFTLPEHTDVAGLKSRVSQGSLEWIIAVDGEGQTVDLFLNASTAPWWYFVTD